MDNDVVKTDLNISKLENEIKIFDYSTLDKETSNYLKEREFNIRNITSKAITKIGKELKQAQEQLSKNGYGCFGEWCESIGYKNRMMVTRLIQRYNLIVTNCYNQELIESLPKSLVYEIAKPKADEELKEMVFNGDITTLKEYRILQEEKKKLENLNKEILRKHDEEIEKIREGIDEELTKLKEKLREEENKSKNIKAENEKELKEQRKTSKEKIDKLLEEIEFHKKQCIDLNESIEEKAIKHKQQDYYLYGVKSNSKDFERFIQRYSSLMMDYFDKLEEKANAKRVIEVSLSKCKIIIEELENNLGEVQIVEYTIL